MGNWSKDITAAFDGMDEVIKQRLCWIGEQAVTIARETGSYNDITGNLRSSIGYILLKDGRRIEGGGFEHTAAKKGDGSEGIEQGKALIDTLRAEYPYGYVLIVCAGMEYASYVENIHGKDVLTSAKMKAETLAQNFMKKLNK